MNRISFVAVLLSILAWPLAAQAVLLGQVDDFEDGTTQSWAEGIVSPNPPTNMATGGPSSVNDNFMHNESSGGNGAGSKMAVFNTDQWTGDYNAAGVTSITADLINLGSTPLEVRMVIEQNSVRAVTSSSLVLPVGSGWQSMTFPIAPGDLATGLDQSLLLSNVTKLWFIHNPNPSFPPPGIEATLGVDNITATPEPASVLMLVLGAFLVKRRRLAV